MKKHTLYTTCALILALTAFGCQKGSSLISLDEEETLTNAATDREPSVCDAASSIVDGTMYANTGRGFAPVSFAQAAATYPVGAIIMTGSGTCGKWSRFYDSDPNGGVAEFLRNNPTTKTIMLYGLERHPYPGQNPAPVYDHNNCEEIAKGYLAQSTTLSQYWQRWSQTRSWIHGQNDPMPYNMTVYVDYNDNVAVANGRWPADVGVIAECDGIKKIIWLGVPTCDAYEQIGSVYQKLGLYYN